MGRWITPAVTAVLVLVLRASAWAGPPTDALHDVFTAVNHVLEDGALQDKPAELLAALRGVLMDSLDVREATRVALGSEWQARTPAEQDEFVRLFAAFLGQAHFAGLAARARVQGGLAVRYLSEDVDGHRATVVTAITGRDWAEIPVGYRMIEDHERWAVYDVVIEGLSIAANYRAQFSRIVRRSSYSDLVAQMKARISEAPSEPAGPGQEVAAAAPPAPERPAEVDEDGARPAEPDPATTPAPVSPAPETASSYWIQMGAFRNAEMAIALVARLLERNFSVKIDSVAGAAGHRPDLLARVRVGPFSNREDAVTQLRGLQSNGDRPFIAREHD